MENRSKIVKELFEIRIHLNLSNETANMRTNLVFEIRRGENTEYLGCYLTGVRNPTFLRLCRRHEQKFWGPTLATRFVFTEDFCSQFLNNNQSNLELLVKELRSLGLF